jgi:hypothetical protein
MTADLRPALRANLLDDPIISGAVGERIHPTILPQGTNGYAVPAIVYNVISEITDHHTQGASGLVMVRMQIDAYAATPNEADALSRAVKDRIDGKRERWTYGNGSPPEGVTIQGVFCETARTGYEADAKLFRSSRDYLIWLEER